MRRSMLSLTALLIFTALLIGIARSEETDLRIITIQEKTVEDPNFEVTILKSDNIEDFNGQRSNPRLVVVAAVLDSSSYGTSATFTGSERLVIVGNNLDPDADGIVIQDYQTLPAGRVGGPQIVETCHLLRGSAGGRVISPSDAEDAVIGAMALIVMKPNAPQTEIDEAMDVLKQHLNIPRNPSAVAGAPASGENIIDWTLSPRAFKYNIYFDTTPGVTRETGTKIPDVTAGPFTHTGLPHGVAHFYIVTAVNKVTTQAGVIETESVGSPEVSATPLP